MIMNKKRVLYIEDDETLAFLTADNLEQYFDVTHCNNGQNGFDTPLEHSLRQKPEVGVQEFLKPNGHHINQYPRWCELLQR